MIVELSQFTIFCHTKSRLVVVTVECKQKYKLNLDFGSDSCKGSGSPQDTTCYIKLALNFDYT